MTTYCVRIFERGEDDELNPVTFRGLTGRVFNTVFEATLEVLTVFHAARLIEVEISAERISTVHIAWTIAGGWIEVQTYHEG